VLSESFVTVRETHFSLIMEDLFKLEHTIHYKIVRRYHYQKFKLYNDGLVINPITGFGNTRGLTQDDLKLFHDTQKQFKNIMEGIIASCEIEKQSSDMFCEMNTNKIVLDFLRFLRRYEKSMKDIKDMGNDTYKVDKLATNLFGNKNKESSDMVIYRTLFEKVRI
jgi:hypothetical protein